MQYTWKKSIFGILIQQNDILFYSFLRKKSNHLCQYIHRIKLFQVSTQQLLKGSALIRFLIYPFQQQWILYTGKWMDKSKAQYLHGHYVTDNKAHMHFESKNN